MKKLKQARDDYAMISRGYPLVDMVLERFRHAITCVVQERGLSKILDVGCGTGSQVVKLRAAGLCAVGIDISPAMLRHTATRVPSGTSFFVLGDGRRLPFSDHAFDGLVLSFALHEKPHPQRLAVLAEGRRVLKPGGTVVVLDYVRPTQGHGRLVSLFLAGMERMAGRAHYHAFCDYFQRGATEGVLTAAGLRLLRSTLGLQGTVGLFECRWETPASRGI